MTALNQEPSSGDRRRFGPAVSLGYTLTAGMIVFTLVGYWIDKKRGTDGVWTLCGMFAGLLYGGYEVWKLVKSVEEEDTTKKE